MSETLTPVFRLEYFIVAAANGTPCDLEPIFNEEKYLHAIAGASVDLPMPIGRTQEYLAKLAGMDVEIPDKPIYRTEYYLAHMIDSTVECPAPIFREEMFYYEWASNEYVTVTGNPVSFTAKAAPLRKLEVAFSPVQTGTGDPSPDNVRPILGWDSLNVEQRGKNLLNVSQANEARKNGASYFTLEYANNSVTMRCDRVLALNVVWEAFRIKKCHVGKTVTISGTITGGSMLFARTQNKDGDWSQSPITSFSTTRTYTITDDDVGRAIGFEFYNDTGADQTASDLQFELGSTASPYQPYNPSSRSISITLGQTVYSGTVDVVTGVVRVGYIKKTSFYFSGYFEGYNPNKQFYFTDGTLTRIGAEAAKMKSNLLTYDSDLDTAPLWSYGAVRGVASTMIFILPFDTTGEANAWASENGLECTFKLATPIEIQLTPQEVESLAGDNTLWSDANQPLTVTYRSN